MGYLRCLKSEILDGPRPNLEAPNSESDPLPTIQANHFRLAIQIWDLDPKSQIWIQDTDSGLESGPGSGPQIEVQIQVQRGSQRRCALRGSASNPFFVHQKIENPKMLRMKFWTSDVDVKKWSKRPRDPHNRIRLEQLCPKVVSDRQNAGRMTSKRRFWHFCPIIENRALNVKDSC